MPFTRSKDPLVSQINVTQLKLLIFLEESTMSNPITSQPTHLMISHASITFHSMTNQYITHSNVITPSYINWHTTNEQRKSLNLLKATTQYCLWFCCIPFGMFGSSYGIIGQNIHHFYGHRISFTKLHFSPYLQLGRYF